MKSISKFYARQEGTSFYQDTLGERADGEEVKSEKICIARLTPHSHIYGKDMFALNNMLHFSSGILAHINGVTRRVEVPDDMLSVHPKTTQRR